MLTTMILLIQNLRGDKRAVTALEYGLIASLIAVFIIAAVSALGTSLSSVFNKISTTL
jgi:pilus assembly protein Flp/PilA